jgi:hypothetical protein
MEWWSRVIATGQHLGQSWRASFNRNANGVRGSGSGAHDHVPAGKTEEVDPKARSPMGLRLNDLAECFPQMLCVE